MTRIWQTTEPLKLEEPTVKKRVKLFKVCAPGTHYDLLGGAVPYENVYVSLYTEITHGKHPLKLSVQESCDAKICTAGAESVTIRRIQ